MKVNVTLLICSLVLVFFGKAVAQKSLLRSEIEQILRATDANVGIAIKNLQSGDTLVFNGHGHFPMQSVYKFQVALAVLSIVDTKVLSLDQKVLVRMEDLRENTWSPMREKYPSGDVELTIQELLQYMVSQSDNNACDILFRLVGGTMKVNDFIRQVGVADMTVVATEEEMHKDWETQFKNWSTPVAMLQLLELHHKKAILSRPSHDLLWTMMVDTPTGQKRIKGLLPKGTVVAHKTGTGGKSDAGIISAVNDVGIVKLPGDKDIIIVVFITNSKEGYQKTEEVIARISKAAYDYFLK